MFIHKYFLKLKKYFPKQISAVLFLFLIFGSFNTVKAQNSITDLGLFGGNQSWGIGVNDSGQVAVSAEFQSDIEGWSMRGFLWENGNITSLGHINPNLSAPWTYARDINNQGQIAGSSRLGPNPQEKRAFIWQGGNMTNLGTLGGDSSSALAINDNTQVVGMSNITSGGIPHGFIWDNGVMTDLGTLGGNQTVAHDINDSGQVVGDSDAASAQRHAFLWDNGVMTDLGTLGGNQSEAEGINNQGQIVGFSSVSEPGTLAFLWQNGSMVALPTLGVNGCTAYDINNLSQIVGRCLMPSGQVHATLWHNGEITDLGTLGGAYSLAESISDTGYIAGRSTTAVNNLAHAALWHIVPNQPPSVGVIMAPTSPVPVNTSISTTVNFTDPNSSDVHTATWNWGDGGISSCPTNSAECALNETDGSGTVTGSHIYTSSGVYTITVSVSDGELSGESVYQYVVVYNNSVSAGFVTGAGKIISPAGAYTADPTLTGVVKFGFVSKYHPGASVPDGNTKFKFETAGFNFSSTDYQWLIVTGTRAQYKGVGTISGQSESYSFILTAIDGDLHGGDADKFRIKIWNTNTNAVVYDNQLGASDTDDPTTTIQNGNIVIHH